MSILVLEVACSGITAAGMWASSSVPRRPGVAVRPAGCQATFCKPSRLSRAAMSADLKAMNASFHSCITAALSTSEGGLDDSTVALLEEHAASFVASAKKVDDHFAARQRELQMDEKECLQQVGAACSRKFAR